MTPSNEPTDDSTFATRRAEQTARSEQDRSDSERASDEKKVGAPVTDPGVDAPDGPARPNWPGPAAASSVGQAAPERTAWAGPTSTGPVPQEQDARPIPTSATPIGDAPVGAATPGPASVRSGSGPTSEDDIYRPDPSVREEYAQAAADRRAGVGADARRADDAYKSEDAFATGNTSRAKDAAQAKDASQAKDTDDTEDDRRTEDDDRTASAAVTSISSGRRRSEAVPDAVAGETDLTPDTEWRELQANFVDDPEGTVSEAATLIERDLAGLRSKLAGGSTEDLRNAFKRYRGLHESLR